MIKHITLLLLAAALSLQAATLSITGPSGLQAVGTGITLTITASAMSTGTPAATQFSINNLPWPATVTAGAAATAAGKNVYCATVANGLNCIVAGMNTTIIGDGVLATILVTVPRSQPSGTVNLPLLNTLGSTAAGQSVTVGAGAPFVLDIASACDTDLSGGPPTLTDFTFVLPKLLGAAACTANADLNTDTKCDVLDAQIIATSVAGVACNAR